MPIIKKQTKVKIPISSIKIQHCFKQELLPISEFNGKELECDLIPIGEFEDSKNQVTMIDHTPQELSSLKDIYTYQSNLSGFSLRQYFNAEWKPKIHSGQPNPIVFSRFGKLYYECEDLEQEPLEDYVPHINVADLI